MPYDMVILADDKRDIQVHIGALKLIKYKWNLKNWDGDLLVTQYFMVTSNGRAWDEQGHCMGRYSLVRNIVMQSGEETTPVFKKDERHFLYLNYLGQWCVSNTVGSKCCDLYQGGKDGAGFRFLPSKTLPWSYGNNAGGWMDDDNTLKVFPCYR